jgi:hypothetical protein
MAPVTERFVLRFAAAAEGMVIFGLRCVAVRVYPGPFFSSGKDSRQGRVDAFDAYLVHPI